MIGRRRGRPQRLDLDTWAVLIAARLAQEIGLPPGNLWEPGIARHLKREVETLGEDASARAFIEAKVAIQLGVSL